MFKLFLAFLFGLFIMDLVYAYRLGAFKEFFKSTKHKLFHR